LEINLGKGINFVPFVLNFRAELAEKSYKELAALSRAAKSAVARWKVGAKRWSM
jgi:hypothetical protein